MAATGSYNPGTKVLTVTGDGMPTPVSAGTFPNGNNANTIAAYTFNHDFVYRGGENTSGATTVQIGAIGVASNGVVIFNPSGGDAGSPPAGFHYVAAGNNAPINLGEDSCGGTPNTNNQYFYDDSRFIECFKNNQVISGYNDYYGSSQYNGDNMRHPDGHSKIIGFCFDGYPVYGPWAYTDPNSNTSAVIRMISGYTVREDEANGRPAYDLTYPAGCFVEDWEYTGVNAGALDTHNGRYCKTPEFPNGTFAYFVTEDGSGNPIFPFMVGFTSKQALDKPDNDGYAAPPEQGGGDDGGGGTQTPTLVITYQPVNATVAAGNTQNFNVVAEIQPEAGTIAYQWQVSTDGGFAWSNLSGDTNSTLTILAVAYMTGYRYRCILTGPVGAATPADNSPLASNLAILTVTGSGSGIDYAAIQKWDSNVGTFDMTPVDVSRDNNNPDFTRNNVRFDNTSENFDMT